MMIGNNGNPLSPNGLNPMGTGGVNTPTPNAEASLPERNQRPFEARNELKIGEVEPPRHTPRR